MSTHFGATVIALIQFIPRSSWRIRINTQHRGSCLDVVTFGKRSDVQAGFVFDDEAYLPAAGPMHYMMLDIDVVMASSWRCQP